MPYKKNLCSCGQLKEAKSKLCFKCWRTKPLYKDRTWNGKPRKLSANGYVLINTQRQRRKNAHYTSEHILIAEEVLGRRLKANEMAHHINGVKSDNRFGNLLLCTRGYHKTLEHLIVKAYMKEHFCEGKNFKEEFEKLGCPVVEDKSGIFKLKELS
jgi:hypothetical protein